jgi:anti-anti-sigma factor
MECKTQNIANVVLFQVEGRIDHTTAKAFESALSPHLAGCTGEEKKSLLDCGELIYISSAGLRVLIFAGKQCAKRNNKIVVATQQPQIGNTISRFDKVFGVSTVRRLENISRLRPYV